MIEIHHDLDVVVPVLKEGDVLVHQMREAAEGRIVICKLATLMTFVLLVKHRR